MIEQAPVKMLMLNQAADPSAKGYGYGYGYGYESRSNGGGEP